MESDKKGLLEESGYRYHFSRMVYFNRKKKKIFSREFIDDHELNQIRKKIREDSPDNHLWIFYFNRPLSKEAKQEILSEFGE